MVQGTDLADTEDVAREDQIFLMENRGVNAMFPPLTKAQKKRQIKNLGGLWIEDTQEYAKFVSAVNTYGVERDGEGITYTDNHFYAYYISIDGEPIPYVDVYLNAEDSQQIIVEVNQTIQQNGRQRPARNRDYIDRAYEFVGYTKNKNHNNDGSDKSLQDSLGSNFLGGNIPRAGRYYDSPNLYVKGQRINRSIYREGVIIDLPPQENGELFRPGDAEDVIKKTKKSRISNCLSW